GPAHQPERASRRSHRRSLRSPRRGRAQRPRRVERDNRPGDHVPRSSIASRPSPLHTRCATPRRQSTVSARPERARMRAQRGPTRYHYESSPCVVDVIEKEEGMSEDNNGKAPAAVPEVEAGLRFIHLMEVQGRMESRALAVETSALVDLLIAK